MARTLRSNGLLERGRGPEWVRLLFPGVFLVYLAQTVHGVGQHSSGAGEVAGYAVLVAFCAAYIAAFHLKWRGPLGSDVPRSFWFWFALMCALVLVETRFAHEDAFVMLVYVAVLTIGAIGGRSIPILVALTLAAAVVPAMIPAWHTGIDANAAFDIPVVSLAMFGFFGVVRANVALTEARTEVARLAAENERNRIARDLHDLLGHSLTTITVKAGLAHRLVELEPERAGREMVEVEQLARQSLSDVRAAVANYRDVTLVGELATARELLRVAGVSAQLPKATDVVDPQHQELFGWVVREGVTNVVRHARAATCRIRLGPNWIEIEDDGVGASARGAGSGLAGLSERVAAGGGALVVGPAAPTGWRVRVDVADQGAAAASGLPVAAMPR